MKKTRLLAVVCAYLFAFCFAKSAGAVLVTSPVSGEGTWETTLLARDLDNNAATIEAYYDKTLNITWLTDISIPTGGGYLDWYGINDLANSLNINGVTGWRLPTMIDGGAPGCDFAFSGTDCGYNVQTTSGATVYSEMASLYYDTLGNLAVVDALGNTQIDGGLTNTGPFSLWDDAGYWTGLDYAPDQNDAWLFDFSNGAQRGGLVGKTSDVPFALFVHSGDVGSAIVPLPGAIWLLGSGLLGLLGVSRRKK